MGVWQTTDRFPGANPGFGPYGNNGEYTPAGLPWDQEPPGGTSDMSYQNPDAYTIKTPSRSLKALVTGLGSTETGTQSQAALLIKIARLATQEPPHNVVDTPLYRPTDPANGSPDVLIRQAAQWALTGRRI